MNFIPKEKSILQCCFSFYDWGSRELIGEIFWCIGMNEMMSYANEYAQEIEYYNEGHFSDLFLGRYHDIFKPEILSKLLE